MEIENKEVDFETYCKTCKFLAESGFEEPCNTCLEHPMNHQTSKPMCWKERKK